MANQEQKERSHYRQFTKGQDLCFTLNRLCPDGSLVTQEHNVQIEDVRGGGFFGQVLLFPELPFVLKTAIPNPWHDFWRRLNWGARDFPAQVSELEAQLGSVKTDLIHEAVGSITEGRFYAPRSYGYTPLPGTFAQAVERLYGRPPRYDNHDNEFARFRQAQAELTGVAYMLGLEHVGQIHPDNPFAMANLWWNPDSKQWKWFDTLPAIPHTGWVWPLFYFGFHRQISQTFFPDRGDISFDRIHTDMYLKTVWNNKGRFSGEALRRIQDNISLYEALMQERAHEEKRPRNFAGLGSAAKESAIDFGQAAVVGAKEAFLAPIRIIRILTDPTHTKELVLAGANRAFETGTITDREFQESAALLESFSQERGRERFKKILKGLPFWSGLYAYYHASGLALKVPEVACYVSIGFNLDLVDLMSKVINLDVPSLTTQEGWLAKLALSMGIFSGFRVLGGLNSFLATKLFGRLTKRNLDTAAVISAIPAIGPHLAIPAQISVDASNKDETIWHYTVRNLIARISKINPAGGWGTELEGQLWNWFGRKIQGWVAAKK